MPLIYRPFHPCHHGGEGPGAALIQDLDPYQLSLWGHSDVNEIWCTGSCGNSSTMRTMSLVVICFNFGSVRLIGVVYRIIECDNLRVVGGIVIIQIVEPYMIRVYSSIDDRNHTPLSSVTCVLPNHWNSMYVIHIAHLRS